MTTAAVTPFARYCIDMRWSDMDALGHLNNVNYFRYLEQVRVEWLDSLGVSINPDGIGPVLADTRCSFRREFTYPARIGITLELVRLGEKSLTLRHHFYREGDPDTVYAVGEVVLVWVDYASGTTVPVPEGIRAAVSPA